MSKHTPGPWAVGDDEGVSTYPYMLWRIGASARLHITLDGWGALCGVNGGGRPTNLVEYLGDRQWSVCRKCRAAIAKAEADA